MTKLEWALDHAEKGIRVFPVHGIRNGRCTCGGADCAHPSKHPRIRGWQTEATTDGEKIRAWWNKWPDANIGGLTGLEGGFVALDIDPRNDGSRSLECAIEKFGKLPDGPIVQTGGGGRHYYFATPVVATKSISGFLPGFPGLDFKSGSNLGPSFVVLPGSAHVSGKEYMWEIDSEFGNVEPPPLPEWILNVVRLCAGREEKQARPADVGEKIASGKRNTTLASLAGSMRCKTFDPEAILAALLVHNRKLCDPPLSEDEVRSIAGSIGRYGPGEPTTPTLGTPAQSLSKTLELVQGFICRYVVFQSEAQTIAVTLWIFHTYVFNECECSPYLAIISAEKQCGKTRLLDVLEKLCSKPFRIVMPSEAVIFRKVEADSPTLLLDEMDAVFGPHTARNHEGLRALINAGNQAGTKVPRVVQKGKEFVLKEFAVYCPKALAGIGRLPSTLMDRAVPIQLRRRKKSELISRFRAREARVETEELRSLLEAHASLFEFPNEVLMPEALGDRAMDGWESLIAIADLAGESWPERARKAAVILNGGRDDDDDSYGVRLLEDCRTTFRERGDQPIASANLLEALLECEESPWKDLGKNGLTMQRLASMLRPYGIRPGNHRLPAVLKGYEPKDFVDAFERYLSRESATTGAEAATPLQNGAPDSPQAGSTGNGCSGVADGTLYVAGSRYGLEGKGLVTIGREIFEGMMRDEAIQLGSEGGAVCRDGAAR